MANSFSVSAAGKRRCSFTRSVLVSPGDTVTFSVTLFFAPSPPGQSTRRCTFSDSDPQFFTSVTMAE